MKTMECVKYVRAVYKIWLEQWLSEIVGEPLLMEAPRTRGSVEGPGW